MTEYLEDEDFEDDDFEDFKDGELRDQIEELRDRIDE
jgi:hypothetical protein